MKLATCRFGGPVMLWLCEQGGKLHSVNLIERTCSVRVPNEFPTAEVLNMKRQKNRPTILAISGPLPALVQKPRRVIPPGIRGMLGGYKFVVNNNRVQMGRVS